MIQIINDDIFNSKEKYLIHQCNCVTIKSAGFAKELFDKYPYSNIYKYRNNYKDTPGTIKICGNGKNQRYVIGLFSQYYPGKPTHDNDNRELRLKWFRQCLFEVSKIENLESVAFPYKIGCNLGGGRWDDYYKMIERFANYIYQQQNAKVIIYKKN